MIDLLFLQAPAAFGFTSFLIHEVRMYDLELLQYPLFIIIMMLCHDTQ